MTWPAHCGRSLRKKSPQCPHEKRDGLPDTGQRECRSLSRDATDRPTATADRSLKSCPSRGARRQRSSYAALAEKVRRLIGERTQSALQRARLRARDLAILATSEAAALGRKGPSRGGASLRRKRHADRRGISGGRHLRSARFGCRAHDRGVRTARGIFDLRCLALLPANEEVVPEVGDSVHSTEAYDAINLAPEDVEDVGDASLARHRKTPELRPADQAGSGA